MAVVFDCIEFTFFCQQRDLSSSSFKHKNNNGNSFRIDYHMNTRVRCTMDRLSVDRNEGEAYWLWL